MGEFIDLSRLVITTQDEDNTYFGLDENGELVRTKISDVDLSVYYTKKEIDNKDFATNSDVDEYVSNEIGQLEEVIKTKQSKLISGQNIKTINDKSLLGSGDINVVSDWSVGNGDGFIKNRTHYANFNNVLYFHKDNYKWISEEIEDTNALYLLPNDVSNYDYVLVTEEKIINNSTISQTDNGTYRIIGSYPYYIEFSGNPSIGEKLESGVRFTWIHSQFIKPLNEVFIPDSFARMEEVDALWDETLALWENIENIDLSDYYTKSEVDDKIGDIDLSDYYTKSEVDDKIGDIDLSDYYTKSEVDRKIVNLVPLDRWESTNIEMMNSINRIDETIGDINNILETI